MTTSPLPADGAHRPAFVTGSQCQAWLAATPLSNPIQAQALFLHQLNLVNHQDLPAAERLAILELLRRPVAFAQREAAKRFTAKALPLVPPEQAAFDTCQSLWQALAQGYRLCLAGGQDPGASFKALIFERCLTVLVESQIDVYLAGYSPTPAHWRALHWLYADAETSGIATMSVEDGSHLGKTPATVAGIYAEALLLHAASPHELSLRHLIWVSRWARRWAGKVGFLKAAPEESRGRPLCVDLDSDQPATYRRTGEGKPRWLDTAQLRQSLKKRLNMLQQGHGPADLQLGEDCTQPACGRLLRQAYQRWCKGGEHRGHDRQSVQGNCELITTLEAIHYYVGDRTPFRQPGYANDHLLRREREEIATFGRIANRRPEDFSQQHGYQMESWAVVEEWQMVDESAQGVHAVHPAVRINARVSQGQLVAVRPESAQQLLLGATRWAMVAPDGNLHLGILVIPGRPEAVAARNTGLTAVKEGYRQAFLLPAIAALDTVASVVLPSGWYKKDKIVEIHSNQQSRQLKLVDLLDRGVDYDRASFEPAP